MILFPLVSLAGFYFYNMCHSNYFKFFIHNSYIYHLPIFINSTSSLKYTKTISLSLKTFEISESFGIISPFPFVTLIGISVRTWPVIFYNPIAAQLESHLDNINITEYFVKLFHKTQELCDL